MLKKFFTVLLFAAGALFGANVSFEIGTKNINLTTTTLGSGEFISLYEMAEGINASLNWDEWTRCLEMKTGGHSFRFMPSSRAVLIDGDNVIYLPFAVTELMGDALIPTAFITGILPDYVGGARKVSPTASQKAKGKANGKLVVIDAGHGGHDTGAQGGGCNEKDIALDIAIRVRDLLIDKGYRVIMTRTKDIFLELPDRSDVANRNGAEIFVSIHVNDAPSKSACGTETYYLSKVQVDNDYHAKRLESSSYGAALATRWKALTTRMKQTFRQQHYKTTQQKSMYLAETVQRRLAPAAGGDNRGVKGKNLSVLRNAYCPSCLVEVGFISNASDLKKLKSSAHKQKLAKAISQGIDDYLK